MKTESRIEFPFMEAYRRCFGYANFVDISRRQRGKDADVFEPCNVSHIWQGASRILRGGALPQFMFPLICCPTIECRKGRLH